MPRTRDFASAKGGNFAIITALIAPVLIGVMGMAIDYSRALNLATDLQDALDAAALAVAVGRTKDEAVARQLASDFLSANLEAEFSDLEVSLSQSQVSVAANAELKTSLSRVLGYNLLDIRRASVVDVSTQDLEVVFVLDTTGSMLGAKLSNMKAAVARMVADLKADAEVTGAKVSFGLVPFSSFVNVGLDEFKRPRSFVDTQGRANSVMSEFPVGLSPLSVYSHLGVAWSGCVESRRNGLDISDAAPNAARPETLFVPAFSPDEPDQIGAGWWNSFVADNAGSAGMFNLSYNFRYQGVRSSTGTLLGDVLEVVTNNVNQYQLHHPLVRYGVSFKHGVVEPRSEWSSVVLTSQNNLQGPNFGCFTAPTVPLTQNASQITNALQSMQAVGSTNLSEGLAWGMRLISPGEPFTQGGPVGSKNLRKVIVFLTDGANDPGALNTAKGSLYTSHGYLNDGAYLRQNGTLAKTSKEARLEMDARTAAVCGTIKQSYGAELFTIQLEVNNDALSSDLLRNCATNPAYFYDTRVASRLDAAFQDIRKKINAFRIVS